MRRLWNEDSLLKASFDARKEEDETVTFLCKAEKDGEPCPGAWNVDVGKDGSIDPGSRMALLQHAKAHNGGFSKMRRVSR